MGIHIYRLDPECKKIWYSHTSPYDSIEDYNKSGWLSGEPIFIEKLDDIVPMIERSICRNRWIVTKELLCYTGEGGHIVDERIPEQYRTS